MTLDILRAPFFTDCIRDGGGRIWYMLEAGILSERRFP